MPDTAPSRPHAVDPADEQRHQPDGEPLWNESYYLDFVGEGDALAGYIRLGLYPNLGVTWWTTMVVGPGRPVLASVAYDLPALGPTGLDLSAAGYQAGIAALDPLEQMRVRATVPAAAHPDAASVYAGGAGTPATLGLDLCWTTDGTPYHYDLTTRYEVPCLVEGTVTVDGEHLAVRGHGQRDHSWGVRDWWAFGWCWAAGRLDDGTRVHVADIRIPGMPVFFGYLQSPAGDVTPLEGLTVTEAAGEEGMPTSAVIDLEPGGVRLAVEPVAFGPLVLTASDGRVSRFPRAMVRLVADDGRQGSGWIEWNQPGPGRSGR